jgi:hypothetical protein
MSRKTPSDFILARLKRSLGKSRGRLLQQTSRIRLSKLCSMVRLNSGKTELTKSFRHLALSMKILRPKVCLTQRKMQKFLGRENLLSNPATLLLQ